MYYIETSDGEKHRLRARGLAEAIKEAASGSWCPEWPPDDQTVDVSNCCGDTVAECIDVTGTYQGGLPSCR